MLDGIPKKLNGSERNWSNSALDAVYCYSVFPICCLALEDEK